jgi:hypothetical protein
MKPDGPDRILRGKPEDKKTGPIRCPENRTVNFLMATQDSVMDVGSNKYNTTNNLRCPKRVIFAKFIST